jgi:hypothetical protein
MPPWLKKYSNRNPPKSVASGQFKVQNQFVLSAFLLVSEVRCWTFGLTFIVEKKEGVWLK